ncbi:MAG TPA: response regulator, partial [Campylobacterales bacterium]|nr:response regulator [Campylobacterales bacterium]
MSHEIRTPLNAILGFVEIMMKSPYDGKNFTKYLDIVHVSGENLLLIINDILDLSKLQSGKFTIAPTPSNLKKSLEHTYSLFSHKAEEKSLYYEIFFSEGFPECLLIDETRVVQVVSNFISNAMKFTATGDMVLIQVDYDLEASHLSVEVRDTGIGIEEEAQAKVFNSFEQEDASVTREYGGTGLGLAICKQLIELMEGVIIFQSTKGEGSTFGFQIPIQLCEEEVLDVGETRRESRSREGYHGRVLIAEDNEMNIILIETLMEEFGVEFEIVLNGQLAVEALRSKRYALVLMDNQMPKLSGIEATREIRTFDASTPIVALSANALKTEQQQFLEVGMNDSLAKPIDYDKLKGVLDRYLV